jgi:hypothetical protein
MAFVAQNGLWLTRGIPTDPFPPTSEGSFIQAVAKGEVKLASLESRVTITSESDVYMGTTAMPGLLRVGRNGDTVAVEAAALDVRSGKLRVHDAELMLGARDTQNETTPEAIDGSGILAGMRMSGGAERSVRWARGHAASLPATEAATTSMAGARSNVGCWEVRGGGLRIVAETADKEVAYGFRINSSLELEIYRRDTVLATGAETFRRVGRFGGVDASAGTMLPQSAPL